MNKEMKKVGTVPPEERDALQMLFERQNGLRELAQILTDDNPALYERLVADMGATSQKLQAWWKEKSEKYHWESSDDSAWQIDFETGDIYLVKE